MKVNRSGQAEPLTKEQFLTVFRSLSPPHRFILALTWHCAERVGAVCNLEVAHVFQANGKPRPTLLIPGRIRKDKVTREIPVTRGLGQILREITIPDSPWLFPSQLNLGRPMNPQVYSRALKTEFLRLGLSGYSTHSARRGAITLLSQAGLNARQIQKISGHASLNSVQLYCEVSPAEVEAGLALL
ncbi:site-specific integrase [Synechococcus sp. PCC 6312]|uniref:tyrosine-type recombinase/integrase n=1 Tax=Synechococcus sp. (strain ATCC 27167 / PCC 6312) TaxID=195253 RepID=UPI00029F4722|nr:site-specific integrase [Synechococcus sp. PCC 6312]AFY62092.1 site-specific recombinase XerD [Synechococcus sp. PCC 6312]